MTSSPRVLIVDDSDEFRLLLRTLLEEAGFEVAGEAPNGAEAIWLSHKLAPDVVTLDNFMPYLTGGDVIDHIREIAPDAAVIVVSGTLQEPPAWATTFVPKDRAVNDLVPAIRAALANGG